MQHSKPASLKHVTVLRSGNRIVLDPTTPKIKDLLSSQLTFTETVFLHGKDKFMAERENRSAVYEQDWECFGEDHKGRLSTNYGFITRIREVLGEAGYEVEEEDLTPHPKPEIFIPKWERLEDQVLRYKQRKVLELIATHPHGRIECFPGWGKSYLIAQAARIFNRAKIAVVTKRVPVMLQRIYPELCQMLPDVGIVGGGKNQKGHRVMCYTSGSLQHAVGDEDMVFVDEGHEACAPDTAYKMAKFEHARIWMFSATWGKRLDSADMRAEAMAGPVRLRVKYSEGVKRNMVVPITVIWSDVIMDVNPCAGERDVEKKRRGIWRNSYRNKLIRRDARLYDASVQNLITVDTLEHALALKKLLPEFELVYNGASQKPRDWKWFREQGLIPSDFKQLTDERRTKLTRWFEHGKLKKVIATPVWNVGVNFRALQVLIRGDGGGSPINDTQIPGRTSRTFDGKLCGILHDYGDQFDTGCEMKAKGRSRSYAENEWKQVTPQANKKSLLQQLLERGEI